MRKVGTKREVMFLTNAAFSQLSKKEFSEFFHGKIIILIHPITKKQLRVRWERATGRYYEEEV